MELDHDPPRETWKRKTMVDKALNFDVKTTGKDEAQKRQELVNMRPGALGDIWSVGNRVQRKCSPSKRSRSKRESFSGDKTA